MKGRQVLEEKRRLIEIPLGELMEKFGGGGHKPGSGSAAALQGMLAAQLVQTVGRLTVDENNLKRRSKYAAALPEIYKIVSDIQGRIYPRLAALLDQDSKQFGVVIGLRNSRDREGNPRLKEEKEKAHLKELKNATDIPSEIAELCMQLAEYAAYVGEHGFRSARGDSNVALNCAISAAAGCMAIIDLNLGSLGHDAWTKKVRDEANDLLSQYVNFSAEMRSKLSGLKGEAEDRALTAVIKQMISDKRERNQKIPDVLIEEKVIRLQDAVWSFRHRLWKENVPDNLIDTLQPGMLFEKMGYSFSQETSLGEYKINGALMKVAGTIDQGERRVLISEQFSAKSRNFTAAHELGHALLHKENSLHRDRAFDDAAKGPIDQREREADKFATFYLMPKREVVSIFKNLFSSENLVLNEETAFAFRPGDLDFIKKYRRLDDFAFFVAGATIFHGKPIVSMAEHFKVSAKSMAIRLSELRLLQT